MCSMYVFYVCVCGGGGVRGEGRDREDGTWLDWICIKIKELIEIKKRGGRTNKQGRREWS